MRWKIIIINDDDDDDDDDDDHLAFDCFEVPMWPSLKCAIAPLNIISC